LSRRTLHEARFERARDVRHRRMRNLAQALAPLHARQLKGAGLNPFTSYADDYYVNVNLHTEMDLPQNRETVLHFFEQIQKKYPSMRNFFARERQEFVLEEDKDSGSYRWCTIENRRVSSGFVNPSNVDEAMRQHHEVMENVPYTLSISPLDCESLNVTYGFDFTYRGNQNELLTEALGVSPAFEKLLEIEGSAALLYEPAYQFALDAECRTQCRISMETRTTAYHVRVGDFPDEQLSVYLTMRNLGSLRTGETFVSIMERLARTGRDLVEGYLAEHVLAPLQHAISMK
jgi:hypothetical protein